MKKTTNRRLELFLMITFPMAVFVGCASNDPQKPTIADVKDKASTDIVALNNISNEPPAPRKIHLLIDQVRQEQRDKHAALELSADKKGDQPDDMKDSISNDMKMPATADEMVKTTTPKIDNNEAQTALVDSEIKKEDNSIEAMVEVKLTQPSKPGLSIVNFASAETNIDENYLQVLNQHASFLADNPNLTLTISGHADSIGSEESNLHLSEERAVNVYHILLSYGAPESQLIIDAFGESSPLNDIKNREENRRVELEYSEELMISAR